MLALDANIYTRERDQQDRLDGPAARQIARRPERGAGLVAAGEECGLGELRRRGAKRAAGGGRGRRGAKSEQRERGGGGGGGGGKGGGGGGLPRRAPPAPGRGLGGGYLSPH